MAQDLFEHSDLVKKVYSSARDILGFDLATICFEGPEEKLKQTVITQPAIFVHSYALTQLLAERGVMPEMTAGHSLGEYTALCAAGSLSFADALRLVKLRGELMQRAGEINEGTMAAIIGMDADVVNDICADAAAEGVVQVANYNSPGQIVISGSVAGVSRAVELAKERGAKRAVPLVVSGAFHSPLMAYAKEGLKAALEETNVLDARIAVFSNVTAQPVTEAGAIKDLLLKQLTSPVRWAESMTNMVAAGADRFYEVGPGTVLRGLLRRIDRSVTCKAINDLDSLNFEEN